MTVSYTKDVATTSGLGVFWKLLFRFRGSLFKLIMYDYLLFLFFFFTISTLYRTVMSPAQKRYFEAVSLYFDYFANTMPISFVLGFYVNVIYGRWWAQYNTIPWPDTVAVFVTANIKGMDARGRLLRRTIIRYINLAYILCMTRICSRVKKRFPSLQHFVDAGILEEKEKEILQEMNRETHVKYWVPLVWSTAVVQLAFKEKRVESPLHHQNIIKSLGDFRTKLAELLGFDRMSFPLLYSQVVTISVYAYFAACLFGHQWLDPSLKYPRKEIDLYFPFFTSLQFFVYMGWLRVAEVMINPFGEDDDDFEMNILIDRNLKTTYLIVDEMHGKHPELVHDAYWDTPVPKELPHTAASQAIVEPTPLEDGSTAQMNLNRQPNMLRRALSRLSTRSISSVRPGGEDTAFSTDSPAMTRARFGASTRSSSSRQSGTSVLGSMIRQGVNKFSTKRKRLDDEASIGDPNGPPSLTRSASNESENTLTPAADDGGFQGTPLVTIEEANERTITSIKDLEELSKRLEGVASSTDASEESNTTSSTVDASKMQEAEVTEAEPGRQRDTIKEEDEPESPA